MKRKLIEQSQEHFVECDNEACNYKIPFNRELNLIHYINKPCPECGDNLLTVADYELSLKMEKAINFINKWFSWTLIFSGKIKEKDCSITEMKIHRGITITRK